jgi:hypothetical protein
VTVDGPGHTHVGIVEDPGHLHNMSEYGWTVDRLRRGKECWDKWRWRTHWN